MKRKANHHSDIDYEWVISQGLSELDKKNIIELVNLRHIFIETGETPSSDDEIIIKTKNGIFSTSLLRHYAFLRQFHEIFRNREHRNQDGFSSTNLAVLDIGACEGYYSIAMARENPSSKIVAVEPNPFSVNTLRRNIELNNLSHRVEILNFCVSDTQRLRELRLIKQVPNISSLSSSRTASKWLENNSSIISVEVKSLRLNDIIHTYSQDFFGLIKIDIEGAEIDVFKSYKLCSSIANIPKVTIECHSQAASKLITNYFTDCGYKFLLEDVDSNQNFHYLSNLYFTK